MLKQQHSNKDEVIKYKMRKYSEIAVHQINIGVRDKMKCSIQLQLQ